MEAAEKFALGDVRLAEYPGLAAIPRIELLRGFLTAPLDALRQMGCDPMRSIRFAACAAFLKEINADPETIFWEPHTNPLDVAGGLIRRRWPNARLIAFPHNVESLVPKTDPLRNAPSLRLRRFRRELAALQSADLVVGISWFDTQILTLFGLPSLRFPYIPVAARLREFDILRSYRCHSSKSFFLILGSAQNVPTRVGMQTQFKMIDTIQTVAPEIEIVMAGRCLPIPPDRIRSRIRIVENPSDQALTELLLHARALWVHQEMTTGALIRVADALSGGLPVLGNQNALHDYATCPGTFIYEDTLDSFRDQISAVMSDEEIIPRLLPDPGLLDRALRIDCAA